MKLNDEQVSEATETLDDLLRIMRYSEYTNTPMTITADCISAVELALDTLKGGNGGKTECPK